MLGSKQLESSLEKKGLCILWTSKLTMNQWCTLVANQAIGDPSCSGQNMASRSREILPLCSAVGTPLECYAHLCASQHRTDSGVLEEVQQKAIEMLKELEHLLNREGLGFSSLKRRRLRRRSRLWLNKKPQIHSEVHEIPFKFFLLCHETGTGCPEGLCSLHL
ncbi:hypothetical protein DUI87_13279 [Hirundo rustica rustica]|uniref:Uncharacterized protein n=1 Tax=Hirundo rustica rustica TaxID=333673 RepID=A0A3M0KGU3_HIRRU|nr:hypothetical protein DUI87_13279 [Hirundo rustica rustica]